MMELDTIFCGDALDVLRTLPDNSVHCCITSPPYYALRDYGVDGQIGCEDTPAQYVARLTEVFSEVRRVLLPSGTLWLNIADTYCGTGSKGDHLDPKNPSGRNGQYVSLAQRVENVKAKDMSLVHESVTEEEIAKIISRWTGIPVAKLNESERNKTLHLDEELHKRVIGQDEGVTKVTEAIIRSKAGIKDPTKPIGSFLFLGPTGVGKTELAKALAAALFDDENNMVRIDMSEYMEKYSVSRLIGAPPGYVGYDEGGQLTEAVRRKPYSVVLFDEIEKAHPDVFNVLLQVLDDGRITDSQGRTVDFKNTILIMTSNIGAQYLLDGIEENGEIKQESQDMVMNELRGHFRPEFLNRLDEIIMFKPLTKGNIGGIINLIIDDLNRRLADKELTIELTDEAKHYIIENGYDPVYGARPLKRYIQKYVETLAAKLILAGDLDSGDTIVIDVENGQLTAVPRANAEVVD